MYLYWILAACVVILSLALHLTGMVEFDTGLPWTAWLVAGLVLLSGGWMAFDGGRALVVGSYVSPDGSGRLGPWAALVSAVGIDPLSTLMKCVFIAYGSAYVASTMALLLGFPSAWWFVVAIAMLGLWYVPFGTVINLIVLLLMMLTLRPPGAG
ncbi:MAG: hypothetical protein Q8W46_11905 [Candidatus Palauibacterales bacterium]|nr:hypothetical protein [Candidatus Palauibacterales bacterium]